MLLPFAAAVHSIRRACIAAMIVGAAALLLPFAAVANSMQELPSGHWVYAALAQATSAGFMRRLQAGGYNPTQTRTRFELAMLVRKAMLALDAATFASPAPELPSTIRVPLRVVGLQQQLAALEELQAAFTQSSSASPKSSAPYPDGAEAIEKEAIAKAKAFLAASLPSTRAGVNALEQRVAAAKQTPALSLADIEQSIDDLLKQMAAIRNQLNALAPQAYQAAWAQSAPTIERALADSIAAAGNGTDAQRQTTEALEALAALQKEFAPELEALHPVRSSAASAALTGFLPPGEQAAMHAAFPALNAQGAELNTHGAEMSRTEAPAAGQERKAVAQVPLGESATVSARVELVDVDRLRTLAVKPGASRLYASAASRQQAKLGVDGSLRLGSAGALRIGYELVRSQDEPGSSVFTAPEAGEGAKATTSFDLGYNISRNSSLSARYELVSFGDSTSEEHSANVAQAMLTVRF